MNETPSQAYISKAHLKGYKSIKDLEIDLKPGLNIIIGPNGSGKTNFLEGLVSRALRAKFNEKSFTLIEIVDSGKNKYQWTIQIDKVNNDETNFLEKMSYGHGEIRKNGKLLKSFDDVNISYVFLRENLKYDFYKIFNPVKIEFGNSVNLPLLTSTSKLQINFEGKNVQGSIWLRPFVKDVFDDFNFSKTLHEFQVNDLVKELEIKPNLIESLNKYTPIENIRLREPFVFNKNEEGIYVDFLLIEFFVNNSWFTWNELSDGTKRIFYIISQVVSWRGTILLEEPELGIHPDQLYKLMDFIKEQSKEKQIIITTHSPEVLNILEKNELDHIIVTHYDNEKGTQMHHLSPKRIKKGQLYMKKVGHLSDFWVHSNLEELDDDEN